MPASTDDHVPNPSSDAGVDAAHAAQDREGSSPAVGDMACRHDQDDGDDTEEEESPDAR